MPLKRDEAFWKEGIKYGSVWRQLWLALFLLRGFILVCGS